MGDTSTTATIEPILNESNITGNVTEKFKATPEGLFLAYSSLLVLALIPIIIGSYRSVKHQKKQQESGEQVETMSTQEALMFPVIASGTLFGIYLVFQIFSKEYINLLLAFYFFLIGVVALTRTLHPLFVRLLHQDFFTERYELTVKTINKNNERATIYDNIFDRQMFVSFLVSLAIGIWYFMKKHWIANNIFGLAFSINGIELLQLNKIKNGCILLGGLFFYDVFWVFGTNVMVTVAKSFEAPIKLTFPQDLIEHGLNADKFAILGLGDIVIPGIFIALLLRFDVSLKRESKTYFYSSFVAYVLALLCTILVMHVFKHAQPALLYIVPLCLIIPLGLALIRGDIKSMFQYSDHEDEKTDLSTSTSSSVAADDETKKSQ